jgi:hypothetical protein
MQQVGGSIGTSALSTIALTATTSYLVAHHTGALAPAVAATYGYTMAFTVSAVVFGLGVILALVLLPSRHRLEELRNEAASHPPAVPAAEPAPARAVEPASARAVEPAPAPGTRSLAPAAGPQPAAAMHSEMHAIPVALLCCSPVISPGSNSAPPRM